MIQKRPEGACKDCWLTFVSEHAAWRDLRAATRTEPIDLDWDMNHPEPKLPKRPAPWPGPRCTTCHRAKDRETKARAHARRTEANFGISSELYWALYEFQGGRCAVFGCRATGRTRRLAVDHDHKCCPGRTSCGKCVRGLLCNPHNEMFGRNGDDPNVFMDMADYLRFPMYLRYLWVQQGREVPTSRVLREYAAKQTRDSFALERGPQELCAEDCELRRTRHAHGTVLFQPENAHPKERASEENAEEARS